MAVAIESDLGIIDPYRASDNFLKKVTLSKTGNKIETFDMMWGNDEVYIFWANKQENSIFTAAIPQHLYKFAAELKKLNNESGVPLVSCNIPESSISYEYICVHVTVKVDY